MTVYFRRKAVLTEDALTGMVADLLEWWRSRDVVDCLLNVARRVDVCGLDGARGIPIGTWDAVHVEVWPNWIVGQPDLVLTFDHQGDAVASLIIEAKLGAPKSGEDDGSLPPEAVSRDQLAKYYLHLLGEGAARSVYILYLTHHPLAPIGELGPSRDAMFAGRPCCAPGAASPLYWASWRDVTVGLRAFAAREDSALGRAVKSTVDALRRVGMDRFSGRWMPDYINIPEVPAGGLFWATHNDRHESAVYRWNVAEVAALPENQCHFYVRSSNRGNS